MRRKTVMRLLVDDPSDGPTNMARDEALLECVGARRSPPTLRFYQWDPPTISLGYFQHYSDYERLEPPAGALHVVRRQTGGGAILHDLEITYSIALPIDHPLLSAGPNRLYELAHEAVRACLASVGVEAVACGVSDDSGAARGPFFCFARRHCYDLLIDGDKVAGSAQRRTRYAVLQHGSIVLANRFAQQPAAFSATAKAGDTPGGIAPVPPWFAARRDTVLRTLPVHFSETLNVALTHDGWTPDERDLAERLRDKYAGAAWTRRA